MLPGKQEKAHSTKRQEWLSVRLAHKYAFLFWKKKKKTANIKQKKKLDDTKSIPEIKFLFQIIVRIYVLLFPQGG